MSIRLFTIAVLAGSVASAGCNRADTTGGQPAVTTTATVPAGGAAAATTAAGELAPAPAAAKEVPVPVAPAIVWREVTIPSGTSLPVVLETTVGSDTSRIEEPVHAHLARAVTDATASAKVKGRAHVGIRFDTLVPEGFDERYSLDTATVSRLSPATKKKDAAKIGGGAAGGAIVDALFGGKKGALIGTAVGGGAGTAAVLSTKGEEVHILEGSALTLRLTKPLTIRVKE